MINIKVPGETRGNVGLSQGFMPISIRDEVVPVVWDTHTEDVSQMVTHWRLSRMEIAALVAGASFELKIWGLGWPPVQLGVTVIPDADPRPIVGYAWYNPRGVGQLSYIPLDDEQRNRGWSQKPLYDE